MHDDHPTLFPLPAPERPPVAPRAGLVRPQAPAASPRGAALLAAARERWQAFAEWSGIAKREIECEVIPGRKARVAIPQEAPPALIIFRLLKGREKGTYYTKPVELWGSLIRFNATLCEDLGLPIGRTTLWRLIYGGFIDAYRVAPMTTLIDLESLRQHLLKTKIDGNAVPFWSQERTLLYREWEKITPEMLAKLDAEQDAASREGGGE